MPKIMSVNAGSSSLKFQLFQMPEETVLTSGVCERIGQEMGNFVIKIDGEKCSKSVQINDHKEAVDLVFEALLKHGVVTDLAEIDAVGHRVLHGGEVYSDSAIFTDKLVADIKALTELGPLHMPANLTGYEAFKAALPNVEHVAVYDTAFHQTMDESTFLYPIPYEFYEDYKIRKYGFHGTSHKYVSHRCAELMGKDPSEVNIITCHLGNGASLCAVKGGKSINTSMGFTPLAGIMMGTRSGDIDPAVIPFIMNKENITAEETISILNNKSGFLGVSGISSDARNIEDAVKQGNKRAILTRKMYAERISQTIGSYFIQLGHVDAIVFTAGLGENDTSVRAETLDLIKEAMQITYDVELNATTRGEEIKISTPESVTEVWVVPTNEELVIAQDVMRLLEL